MPSLRPRLRGHAPAFCNDAPKLDVQGAAFVTTAAAEDQYKGCERYGCGTAFEPISRSHRSNLPGAPAWAAAARRVTQAQGALELAVAARRVT